MRAIDAHVHIRTGDYVTQTTAQQRSAVQSFGARHWELTPPQIAEYYAERDLHACIFSVDKFTSNGLRNSNDEVAQWAAEFPEVFTGIASVDPWLGAAAVDEVRRSIEELGLKGVKFQPISQQFFVSDPRFAPLWSTISELGVPVIIHTGTTGSGKGSPGGGGLRLKYGSPIPYLDDLAADFPELTIVAAHPGWPWSEELLAVAHHKGNVFMDLSGWAPKYLPEITVRYARSLLADKTLFGSDFPLLSPDRWLDEFDAHGFAPEVREKILLGTAARVFGIKVAA
jgi:predicted TIM-barrel fold metal-dependent hydrolase